MAELYDLQIHVNGEQTFFINEKVLSKFSGMLRKKMINQENPRKNYSIEIDDFPGGPDGFEMISRFCYNNGGGITVTVSNVSILHCCSVYLDMNEKVSRTQNLMERTETFLEGMFYWSWNDLLVCLKSCDSFSDYADSIGFLQKLIDSLLSKIAQSFSGFNVASPSSFSSSPETNSELRTSSSRKQPWWFDDLTVLPPKLIEKIVTTMGLSNGNEKFENNYLTVTRFLLHYLKTYIRNKKCCSKTEYGELAQRAISRVVLIDKTAFSCRNLFWVLRVIVSGFDLNKSCRKKLETLIGGLLDKAALDDLLVPCSSGHFRGSAYDVNLVLRLIKVFVDHRNDDDDYAGLQKMKKVGKLIDKYLQEISPDQNLKVSKFFRVLASLPDSARDCFDGVYRAIDMYLESHPNLSDEELSSLCKCLNYEKLSLEACKDLAKNPRIPPRIAVQALISQQSKVPPKDEHKLPKKANWLIATSIKDGQMGSLHIDDETSFSEDVNEEMRMNLERMQWRTTELEKVCIDLKDQMSKLANDSSLTFKGLRRFC